MTKDNDHLFNSGINHAHRSLPIAERVYAKGTPIKFQLMASDPVKSAIVLESDHLTLKVSCVGTEWRIFKSMVVEGVYVTADTVSS